MRFYSPDILPSWQRWILPLCPNRYHLDRELGAWVECKLWLGKLYAWRMEICHVDGIARLHQEVFQPRSEKEFLEQCYQISEG